ncbi:hypothetical protein OIU76_018315 [Salix suchowensis]|nr:hypothetical protein OIU76_018315 [Salix suchowensis]
MEPAMQRKMLTIVMGLASLLIVHVNGETSLPFDHQKLTSDGHYLDQMQKMQAFKHSLLTRRQLATPPTISSSPAPAPQATNQPPGSRPSVYEVTTYGADPTGKLDSTEALLRAIADAFNGPSEGKPLRLPAAGAGNLKISGGTLTASDDFPTDGYLIDLSASSSSSSSYNYEYITMKDLMLDCNFRGGGISVINSLRTSIDNCYISHFSTEGILVQNGHETYIRNSFLGQHITAGGDPGERNFSGTAINLMGNDNAVTDVVIFSAAIGVMVSGQANTLSGVHCYNKATGFGEGINIVDNMFAGSDTGIEIVQLDQSKGPFKKIDQVVVDRNNVKGMNLKATVARGSVKGNGTSWTVDFSPVLLFPNLINHVQYSLSSGGATFPSHALRNVSGNRVVIESDIAVPASVFVMVEQGSAS